MKLTVKQLRSLINEVLTEGTLLGDATLEDALGLASRLSAAHVELAIDLRKMLDKINQKYDLVPKVSHRQDADRSLADAANLAKNLMVAADTDEAYADAEELSRILNHFVINCELIPKL